MLISSSLLLIAYWFNSIHAVAFFSLITAVLAALYWYDLQRIEERIKDVSSTGISVAGGLTAYKSLFSKLGRSIALQLEALKYRIYAVSWEAEHVSSGDELKIEQDEILGDLDLPKASAGSDTAVFYQKVIGLLGPRFRCAVAAIAYSNADCGAEQTVLVLPDKGRKFETHLRKILRGYFEGKEVLNSGLQDGLTTTQLSEFTVFGLRYAICYPIVSEDSCRKAVLWLGYSVDTPPTEQELKRAKVIAGKIELELKAWKKLYELSDKVVKAESVSKERSDFIAHVSHDIRSPLNNIKAILNLIKLEGVQSNSIDVLDVALSNCDTLSDIVADILDYSRHKAGKLSANFEILELNDFVRNIVETFQISASLRGLSLAFRSDQGNGNLTESYVRIDRRQIKRVISNLISNALKYTKQGSIVVSVKGDAPSGWSIAVTDSGIGISEHDLKKIFTPFSRFDFSTEDGVGLGLALSKILVELNHGRIQAKSAVGAGSQFEIFLPAVEALNHSIAKSKLIAAEMHSLVSVLVVDDDPDFTNTFARTLELSGFEVFKAQTIKEAIGVINFNPPDVVISDCLMPDGGGKRLLQYISSSKHSINVAILSGNDNQSERNEYRALGASGYFIKPADIDGIICWIEEVVGKGRDDDTTFTATVG